MKEAFIDCRGRPCPEPVVEVRRKILTEHPDLVRVVVDNSIAVENLTRLARSLDCEIRVASESTGEIHLLISKTGGEDVSPAAAPALSADGHRPRIVVMVRSNVFGSGDDELGAILMRAFIKTLKELSPPPELLLFVNGGVRLTTGDSPLVDDLRALENNGVRVLSCGTCLDFFHLKDQLRVGAATNMYDTVTQLAQADRVIEI